MKTTFTVRRIHINGMGYDKRGRYWGVGDRLYYSPELEATRAWTQISYVNEPYCRAPHVKLAREVFARRLASMQAHPTPPRE